MDFCNTMDLFSRCSLLFQILFLIRILAELPAALSEATWFSSAPPAKFCNRIRDKSSPRVLRCPQKSEHFLTIWRLNMRRRKYLYCTLRCIRRGFRLVHARNMKLRVMQEEVSVASYGHNLTFRLLMSYIYIYIWSTHS